MKILLEGATVLILVHLKSTECPCKKQLKLENYIFNLDYIFHVKKNCPYDLTCATLSLSLILGFGLQEGATLPTPLRHKVLPKIRQ
jgi:hypothetical protein